MSQIPTERACTQCGIVMPLESFAMSKTGKYGRHTWCRTCKAARARLWYGVNAEARREYDRQRYRNQREWRLSGSKRSYEKHKNARQETKRIWKLMSKHGLTPEQKTQLYEYQDCRCAICRESLPQDALYVDHDHKTGANRGLLCHFCNVGLGHFRDDERRLVDAANYLASHREHPLRRSA